RNLSVSTTPNRSSFTPNDPGRPFGQYLALFWMHASGASAAAPFKRGPDAAPCVQGVAFENATMQENPYAAPTVDPHASAPRAPGQNGPRDWTIGHAIGVGWQAVKEKPLPLIGGFALVAIINQGISQIVQSAMGSGADAGTDPMAAV